MRRSELKVRLRGRAMHLERSGLATLRSYPMRFRESFDRRRARHSTGVILTTTAPSVPQSKSIARCDVASIDPPWSLSS